MHIFADMRITLLVFSVLFFLSGCDGTEKECVVQPDISDIDIDLTFENYVDSIDNLQSKDQLVALLTREPLFRDYIFRRAAYPNDSVFINELHGRFHNPHFDTLIHETRSVFGDQRELENEFRLAFQNMKHYYPDFVPPKVKTLVSGLDTDLYVSDTLIIVSLDFYLGPGAKYRPSMYAYLLRQYVPTNVVPSCLLMYGIDERFNKTEISDRTALADMIAYGKSYYFAKHMLPCTPDSILLRYTAEEINGSYAFQDLIWARLIENNVLFETSHLIKQRYLGERPKTLEIGEKCPGRIGQWVGWQIVKSYMDTHPNVTLSQLMETSNAQEIFKQSGYKPDKR